MQEGDMTPTAKIFETATEMPPKLEQGTETERMQLVAPSSWFQRIDEWRRKQPRIPSKSEAIRALVDHALAADIKAPERKGGRK
jgi:hypothetical protein